VRNPTSALAAPRRSRPSRTEARTGRARASTSGSGATPRAVELDSAGRRLSRVLSAIAGVVFLGDLGP